jgi:NAD(P)H dehydrogenase (quinone)
MTELLVTGASGYFGQRVLHHLLETLKVPASRIAAASRKPDSLAAWAARGVTVRAADFDDPPSLKAAFAGVQRLLVVSTDALDEEGKRLRQHVAAVKAADAAGVKHILYTSLPEAERALISFAPDHAGTEKAIAESSIPGWTILRNNWYFENLFYSIPHAIASGQWYSAADDGKIAYIARDDLALAAAVALASDFAGKRTLTLTGKEVLSNEDIAALVRLATGRPLQVVNVPVEGLIEGMKGAGLPESVARVFASIDTNTKGGFLAGIHDDFRALTGREPQPIQGWITANASAFAASHAA